MTTTEAWRDDEGACAERSNSVDAGDRSSAAPVEIGARARAKGKAFPPDGGITPAEAELLGAYKLHNG